jgi:hypothetical protein
MKISEKQIIGLILIAHDVIKSSRTISKPHVEKLLNEIYEQQDTKLDGIFKLEQIMD